jgi:hypothetical protein
LTTRVDRQVTTRTPRARLVATSVVLKAPHFLAGADATTVAVQRAGLITPRG